MPFFGMALINKFLSMERMAMNTMKTMLSGTLATVMTSWKDQHRQWVFRQMTQNFLNSLVATCSTVMHLHLKCMHQQVAASKKHASSLSRFKSATGYFSVDDIGAFDGLPQPSTDRKLAKSHGTGKKGKRKGKTSSYKGGEFPSLGHLESCPKQLTTRSESRPPMSKKRPTETGTNRGAPHHAPRLRPDQCRLCRKVGHRASECPSKGQATSFSLGKRAFGTCALGCAVPDATRCNGRRNRRRSSRE